MAVLVGGEYGLFVVAALGEMQPVTGWGGKLGHPPASWTYPQVSVKSPPTGAEMRWTPTPPHFSCDLHSLVGPNKSGDKGHDVRFAMAGGRPLNSLESPGRQGLSRETGSFQFAAGVLSASSRRTKKVPEARIAPVRRPEDRGAHGRPRAVQIHQWFLGFQVGPPLTPGRWMRTFLAGSVSGLRAASRLAFGDE